MQNQARLKTVDKPKTAEEASRNFEEHLRLTCPNWTERQIIVALDDHRVKNLGLPPLAESNLTKEIEEWISRLDGEFQTREVFDELAIPINKKGTVSKILARLIEKRIIERSGKQRGRFRRVETELDLIDIFNCDEKTVNIQLPLGIHEFAEIMPGNIIIVAGEPNMGKTALLLNIAASNMYDFDVSYFSSEMGDRELKKRLKLFEDVPFEDWRKFKPYARSENFADVVKSGEGSLNLIDFLEIHDEFYLVAKYIYEIYRKLNGAVAVIALQKNPGTPYPLGGVRSLEKARLAITLERHNKTNVAVIRKLKNWKGKENPNGKQIQFKLVQGYKFITSDVWSTIE